MSDVFSAVDLVVRPRRIRCTAYVVAVLLFAFFFVGALLVNVESSGFVFRFSDQVAMVVLGLILAGGALLFARPRLRAGPEGVEVRTSVRTHRMTWDEIEGISFPDGAQFARLELPDDEYQQIAAVQAVDRGHAARAISALRELHARYRG